MLIKTFYNRYVIISFVYIKRYGLFLKLEIYDILEWFLQTTSIIINATAYDLYRVVCDLENYKVWSGRGRYCTLCYLLPFPSLISKFRYPRYKGPRSRSARSYYTAYFRCTWILYKIESSLRVQYARSLCNRTVRCLLQIFGKNETSRLLLRRVLS